MYRILHGARPMHAFITILNVMMSFLGVVLTSILLSWSPLVAADTTNGEAPDTTDRPSLRECGMMMPPLQDTYQHALPMNDSPERRALLREVEDTIREVQTCYGERRPRVVMSTYRALVVAQYERGHPEAALESFDEFFAQYSPADDSTMVSWMYSNRGRYHYLLGYPSRSLRDYAQAVSLTPHAAFDVRIQRLNNLALTYSNLQELEPALYYLKQVEREASKTPAPTANIQLEHGRALSLNASVLQRMADAGMRSPEETLPRIEELAERAFAKLEPINRDLAIGPLLTLAVAYIKTNDPERATAILERVHDHVDASTSLNRRTSKFMAQGRAALQTGRIDDAQRYFEASQQAAAEQGLLSRQRQTHTYLGQVHERRGDLRSAREHYETAATLTDAEHESIRGTLWSTRTFSDRRAGYDGLMRTLRRQGQADEALDVWLRFRGRFLRDTRMQAALLDDMAPNERMQYDSLTTALNTLRTRRSATSDTSTARDVMGEEAVIMADRNELVDLSNRTLEIDRRALQQWLGATNRTLIAYHIDAPNAHDDHSPTLSAYVVRPDTVVAIDLPHTSSSLNELLEQISPLLTNDRVSASISMTAFNLNGLHDAYQELVQPIREYLPADGGLIVAPDGPLLQFPFAALVTDAPEGPHAYDQARYLIEERPILSSLSPSLLSEETTDESHSPSLDLAAFGMSEFGDPPPSEDLLATEIRLRSGADSLSLAPLPGVATELDRLSRMFNRTHTALNESATPSAVRAHGSDATIVHIASHALLSPADPLRSAFVLSGEPGHDGLLRVHDIMRPGAPVPLVVLSGCSTARGELRSGEGLLGLQYAFQASGAQSTLSHLWPTDDDTAVALSTRFYDALSEGHPKDVALQQAQLAFLDAAPDRRSPFFWASPVLFGNPNALDLSSSTPSWWAITGWLALVLATGGLLFALVRRYRYSASHA